MTNGTIIHTTNYLDGFQYYNNGLQFFPTAEGYVKQTTLNNVMTFDYVYNYTDHLGNIRLSYTKDPLTQELKILEENHYYPFGWKHSVYADTKNKIEAINNQTAKAVNPDGLDTSHKDYDYKYNGKEFQDELGLGWYDYQARNYDPALGRWMNIDPLAEMSRKFSPYAYALDNPVFFIDPDGMVAKGFGIDWKNNGDGTYTAEEGDSAATLSQDAGIDYERANELVQSQLGENYTDTDGVVKSDVEVGDKVAVPEQQIEIAMMGISIAIESISTVSADESEVPDFGIVGDVTGINSAMQEQSDAVDVYNSEGMDSYIYAQIGIAHGEIAMDDFGEVKSGTSRGKGRASKGKSATTLKSSSQKSKPKSSWNSFLQENKGKYKGKDWIQQAAKDYRNR